MVTDVFGWKRRQKKRALEKANIEALESVKDLDVTNIGVDNKNVTEDENGPENGIFDGVTVDVVETLDIDKVKEYLEKAGIAFAHNTGEKKLREKLRVALNGAND